MNYPLRITIAALTGLLGIVACSSESSPSSSAASSCAQLAACCPLTDAPAGCKATADLGNDAQCKVTFAGFQDMKKCPKADWSCEASADNTTFCRTYKIGDFGKVACGAPKSAGCDPGQAECTYPTGAVDKVSTTALDSYNDDRDANIEKVTKACVGKGGTLKVNGCTKEQIKACREKSPNGATLNLSMTRNCSGGKADISDCGAPGSADQAVCACIAECTPCPYAVNL